MSFLSFYHNPLTTFMGDPDTFFYEFSQGDAYKLFKLAVQSLHNGFFLLPVTHSPGLEVIDIVLLWIHPKFPIILFLTLLNCVLWAVLFTQIYCFGRERIGYKISFIIPFFLLIPHFSIFFFLRGAGLPLGTSFTVVSLNIGIFFILFSLSREKLFPSILGGMFLAFSGYIWSMSDALICYSSMIFFTFMSLYFVFKIFTKNINFLNYLYSKKFNIFKNLTISFSTFWILTIPYRYYIKSISMVPTDEVWKRIWQLPLYWNDVQYANNWIFRGGGFPFCRAYPETCHTLHEKIGLHDNLNYLKELTYQTFITDPIAIIKWKMPFFVQFWLENEVIKSIYLGNTIIFFFFPIILLLFLIRQNKLNTVILFFCFCVFSLTFATLFLTHIEVRYFYILKFTLCVGLIFSLYAFIPTLSKNRE